MFLKDKYQMLKAINDCPDTFISKEIIFNVLNWTYSKIDNVVDLLLQENLIKTHNFNNKETFSLTSLGQQFIKEYPKLSLKERLFNSFLPILLAIVSIVLGLLSLIKT